MDNPHTPERMAQGNGPLIAFLGAGRMAEAMMKGLLATGRYSPNEIACAGKGIASSKRLAAALGVNALPDGAALLRTGPAMLVLACKPQSLPELPEEFADLTQNRFLVSILAGTPLHRLARLAPRTRNIVRIMPNTPGRIGAGISAYTPLHALNPADQALLEDILGALGSFLEVPESEMDAVTALSGSGPAYAFEFIAALAAAGTEAGLSPAKAKTLALHTVLGAARLVAESGEDPDTLREAVTSPGGTTLAGLRVLEIGRFRDLLRDTVAAARARSEELSSS